MPNPLCVLRTSSVDAASSSGGVVTSSSASSHSVLAGSPGNPTPSSEPQSVAGCVVTDMSGPRV